MEKNKLTMKNETEFIFDETLTEGFTVVPNNIFAYEMSDGAIGLYSRILRVKNIPGWKIYQSTLQNKSNGESKIRTAINELIAYGFIKKITLREKGKIAGIKYMVYSSSQKTDEEIKLSLQEIDSKKKKKTHVIKQEEQREEQRDIQKPNNVESPENTDVQPKRDFQERENLERENQALKKKDSQKRKTLKKKDITTTKEKNIENKNSSSSNDISNNLEINLDIKGITKTNIKRLKVNQEQIDLLEKYIAISEYDNLDKFAYYIAKQIKNNAITEKDLELSKKISKKKKGTGLSPYFEKDKDYYAKIAEEENQRYFDEPLTLDN